MISPHPAADAMAASTTNHAYAAAVNPLSLLRPDEPMSRHQMPPLSGDAPTSDERTLQVAPPFQNNQGKREARSPKMWKNPRGRAHRINRQDETTSADGDDRTNSEVDVVSSSMIPGAVSVAGIITRSGRPTTPATPTQFITDSNVGVDPGSGATSSEPQIVAFLAPDDDDQHQIEARITQRAEELLKRQMEGVIVADEVNADNSSTFCSLKKRTLLFLLGLFSVILIIGGVVGGVLSSTSGESTKKLTGTIPTELGRLTSLPFLNMSDSQMTGTIPTQLGQLTTLTYLGMSNNQLTGIIPTELGQLLSLEHLEMIANQFTGTIPTELVQLTSLTYLGMSNNQLTGTIPTELGQLVTLEALDISGDQLTGTIPTELGQLTLLTALTMINNQLTGTIPTELGQLTLLTALDMYANQLTGTIPTELGQMLSFKYLSISSNQLTGTIPTELGRLLSLTSLDMYSNQLTGTIPTELGQLVSLTNLVMYYNQLTGTIPTELVAGIANLTSAEFSNNALTGSLEQSFCVESGTSDYCWWVDCDKVECSCCFAC
jgi:Leucine-rich repeat (LRR) protein